MAKTMNQDQTASGQANGQQKDRKKQARREAKVMLAVEKAKASLEKAQRKLAKAKQRLEVRAARLQSLENKLSDMRSSQAHDRTQSDSLEHGLNGQSGQGINDQTAVATMPSTPVDPPATQTHSIGEESAGGATEPASTPDTPIPANQEVSLPPAEGRADILPEDQATGTQEATADSAEASNAASSSESEAESSYPMPQEQQEDEAPATWASSPGEPSQEETY